MGRALAINQASFRLGHLNIARSFDQGLLRLKQGRYREAEAVLREAALMRDAALESGNSWVLGWRAKLAEALNILGRSVEAAAIREDAQLTQEAIAGS